MSEDQIRNAVEKPDRTEPNVKGRLNAFKDGPDNVLRVTYRDDGTRIIVVTVTPRKKAKR